MQNKSNYLDNLIQEWDQESQSEYKEEREFIESNIDKYKKSVKYGSFMDKVILPILCFYYFLLIFKAETWGAVIFHALPFLAVGLITYLQFKTNKAVNEMDCSLSVVDFFNYRFKVLSHEVIMWQRLRFIFYPAFFIHYIAVFILTYNDNFKWAVFALFYNLVTMGLISWYIESSIKELKEKREASRY